jgi:hypothetical protein
MVFPDQKRFQTNNNEQSAVQDIILYYRLVYCVDCSIPVYWMCLSENTPVQRVSIDKTEYLVFKCDACHLKSTNGATAECRECKHSTGYLKKVQPININDKQIDLGHIHPVCAMSFPNVYQFGSPANMNIKLCAGVDLKEIAKISDQSQPCDICQKVTPRMLKCQDYEKYNK